MKLGYSAGLVLLPLGAAVCLSVCRREDAPHEQPPAAETAAEAAMAPDAALIHHAAHGNAGGVLQALRNGADIETRDESGLTPLMWAAQQEVSAVVSLLLEQGANPLVRDNEGWSPLHCAASGGSKDGMACLLAVCKEGINTFNSKGETPLLVALRMHREDIARMLVEAGADVNAKNNDNRNAVDVARAEGMHDLGRELVKRGGMPHLYHTLMDMSRDGRAESLKKILDETPDVDLEMHDAKGKTALIHAAESGQLATMQVLLDAGARVDACDRVKMTPLLYAALEGHVEAVKLLQKHGASIKERSSNGWTPLLVAAGRRQVEMELYLLEQGVDVNLFNNDGETAMIIGAANDQTALVSALIERGADMEAVDNYGWTALMVAAAYGQVGVLGILANAGADLERQDANGWTAALCAASADSVEGMHLLVQHGANLNHTDAEKRSALVIAAELGHEKMVRYLVEGCRMPLDAADDHGWTPLMHAAALGRERVVEFLLRSGADATLKSNQGETAYCLARLRGEQGVLRVFEEAGITE
ncbi:MAG: ankyrin repeat domain-containing protein [Akkermansia sp.]|nr:ankyrin repeat domain-containing protein [Akkermansia sp.]